MTDTTAKIRAKGCDGTGLTEELAGQLFTQVGRHYMAIVEFRVEEPHGPNAEGKRRVDLILEQVEPATDDQLAEHLRELTRTLYQNRAIADGQTLLDDTLTPDLKDAIAAGAQHEPHPFLPTDAAADNPSCEVCGLADTAAVHADQATVADPFDISEEEAEPVPT